MKRVDVDPTCPKCGVDHENVLHALVSCAYSQLVWCEFNLPTAPSVGMSFSMWFSNILHTFSEGDITRTVAALYYTWRARNQAVWDGLLPLPRRVKYSAEAALQAWMAVHYGNSIIPESSNVTSNISEHVQSVWPRCYFDAGYCATTRKVSYGAVLLTAQGGFLAACAGPLPDCYSPLMAEAEACKQILPWLRDKGLESVEIYTDCSQLRSQLQHGSSIRSHAGYAIQITECRSTYSCRIGFLAFRFYVLGLCPA
ncbi:uncharacterized protein LOC116002369 [Ipomoea triloba]|uniref:uncharacterized protein LOC116002369 n=1 Tax=Ipomoea triloba TaxID=35885 RepID=UPI00125E91F9|nr:uncharacterized protein LOC116002369 [Ipomoea triloba]